MVKQRHPIQFKTVIRRHLLCLLTVVCFLSGLCRDAIGKERYEFYNGIRSLGIGGANVAIVNDETALWTNPAALGKLRDYFITLADPEIEVGSETSAIAGTDATMLLDPQDVLDNSLLNPGKRFHMKGQVSPSFVVTNFGFGILQKYQSDAFVSDDATTYDYFYREDLAVALGINFRMFDGKIKIGVSGRGINRVEVDRDDILPTATGLKFETMEGTETLAREGGGVGADAGLILTGPWKWLPSIAAVYKDIGGTTYSLNKGMQYTTTFRPRRTPATVDAGFSVTPILSNNIRMTFTAEMTDVMDAIEPADEEESDEVMRRIHGGVEFNFYDIFFIRGGMNQGYWTAGLELTFGNSQFQLASYGEEVADIVELDSTEKYKTEEDRRYVAKYAFRF